MNGLNSSSAIFLGSPHWCNFSSGPTTITERPELWRDARNDVQHHPVRARAGSEEGVDQLQALDDFLLLGVGTGGSHQILFQLFLLGFKIDGGEQLLQRFRADAGLEGVFAV